ncbi:MAG: hypothetical protein GTO02_20860 [Candidatus Dadabacteria bacterium]|nr:hypothetical protein [Candidatus Dadabacteria bacterium]
MPSYQQGIDFDEFVLEREMPNKARILRWKKTPKAEIKPTPSDAIIIRDAVAGHDIIDDLKQMGIKQNTHFDLEFRGDNITAPFQQVMIPKSPEVAAKIRELMAQYGVE